MCVLFYWLQDASETGSDDGGYPMDSSLEQIQG